VAFPYIQGQPIRSYMCFVCSTLCLLADSVCLPACLLGESKCYFPFAV
jgi:hypothetical protein